MSGKEKRMIGVVGAGACDDATAGVAASVGRLLAEHGVVVVCGGRGGVMEAASRGAAAAGGVVVGILPGEDRMDGNPFLTVCIATGLGEARNAIIARTCDGLIGVGGEFGTLSEIALALKMGKPVVSLGSWEVDEAIQSASTPEEGVRMVLDAS